MLNSLIPRIGLAQPMLCSRFMAIPRNYVHKSHWFEPFKEVKMDANVDPFVQIKRRFLVSTYLLHLCKGRSLKRENDVEQWAAERKVFATATDRKRRLRRRHYCRIVHYTHNTFTGFTKHSKRWTVVAAWTLQDNEEITPLKHGLKAIICA